LATHPEFPGARSHRDRKGEETWSYHAPGRHGRQTRLPGFPGDPAFQLAYDRLTGDPASVIPLPGADVPMSLGKAFERLETTMEWLAFDEATQRKNTRLIERFLSMKVKPDAPLIWRNVPVQLLDADQLRALIEGIYADNKTVALHMLVAIKKLLFVAIHVEKWIKPQDDPSLSITVRIPKSTANPAWPMAMRDRFEARHPVGSTARTCYALGFWLGNRRSDIATIQWDQLIVEEVELFDGSLEMIEAFDFRQKKNRNKHGGREMFIPVVDKLAQALEPLDRAAGGTVLKTRFGESFSEKSLTNQMQLWTRQADIPPGYTLHGLRRTFGTYLAECNVQARAIMEAMGHSSMTVTDGYVREANKKRMMVDIARAINNREEKRDTMRRRAHLRVVG
jgi:integrase